MTTEEYAALKERLRAMADPSYRAFHQKLVPEVENLLGRAHPRAAPARAGARPRGLAGLPRRRQTDTYEETMLQGLVLGCAKMEPDELFERLREFIPKIGNWAVNDSVCAGLKLVKKHRAETLAFLRPYFAGGEEFEVRFAVVMLMDYYIDEEYIGEVPVPSGGGAPRGVLCQNGGRVGAVRLLCQVPRADAAPARGGGVRPADTPHGAAEDCGIQPGGRPDEGGDPRAAQGGPLKKGGKKRTVRHSPLFSGSMCVWKREVSRI